MGAAAGAAADWARPPAAAAGAGPQGADRVERPCRPAAGWTRAATSGARRAVGRRIVKRAGRRRVDAANLDHGRAIAQHVELCGGRVGQVDDSIADEGAAIVDPHHDAAAVLQIRDPHVGGQRQRLMSGGHAVHVVGLAGRGPHLVEAGAIPGGDALAPIAALEDRT